MEIVSDRNHEHGCERQRICFLRVLDRKNFRFVVRGILLLGVSVPAFADADTVQQPQPAPLPAAIPQARDIPFPGVIHLKVDATDLDRHIMSVHETVPVPDALAKTGGDMVLLYPMWLPGHHSPSGKIDQLGGLVVHAGAQRVQWRRDEVTVSAFHIPVPKGATTLDVDFQFLSPVSPTEGRVVMTPSMLNVQWNTVSLYPAGYFTRQINVVPEVRLPHGWKYGTALRTPEQSHSSGDDTVFQSVSYNTLVDSPMFAGRYFRQIDLAPGDKTSVTLNLVADHPDDLKATDEQIAAHRSLVVQANKLFASHHYDHYDFLLALTKELGGIGLEHHRSSENSGPRGYFTQWDKTFAARDLLAHEYTHSWNGKYRRPENLWTPDFNMPMRGEGLWVYEGQTQYWGYVLAARSGLMTVPQTIDAIAAVAASYDVAKGHTWRPLIDTTNDPIIAQRAPLSWRSWQRSEDYYSEGQLIWLDADTLIREKTGGKKSLDDFASMFFGTNDGSFISSPYSFDEVVKDLNAVVPYDWASFLHQRLDQVAQHAPLDGLARGGYKLVFNDKPNAWITSRSKIRKMDDYQYSLGLIVKSDGNVVDVLWDGPAWKSGLTRDMKIVAVNGEAYDSETLDDVIRDASVNKAAAIDLLVENNGHYRTVSVDWHGGLRIPHLERISGSPDRLSDILKTKE